MATLMVRDVPDEMVCELERLAADDQVSLSAEVLRLLAGCLPSERPVGSDRHDAALAELWRTRWTPPAGTPDSVEFLREDRDR